MQLTSNYNLKKPEGADPVEVQDFNDNADIIDEALKKKAESSGGDISDMVVKTLDNITDEFPVPVAGEKPKTFLAKVKKFFEDTKNWMTGVCLIGQIVNNCVTNNAKLPLSAAQGKVLMDLYTVLNTKLINWKVVAPVQGTCNLNTTAWIETGSSIEWIVVNGLCFIHYVLIVKADSGYDAELATGLPTPKFFIHECVNEWDISSNKKCQLMVSGERMTGTVKVGTYVGTICYAVA